MIVSSGKVGRAAPPPARGNPRQLARPSPLRDGVPLFSAPRRRLAKKLMRNAWPRGYK
jgi:hypothetical protein